MSSDRIDTPDAPPSDPKESPEPVISKTSLNANAEEFRPGIIKQKLQLRPNAPEFIPERARIHTKSDENLCGEVAEVVKLAGISGIIVRDIPVAYYRLYSKILDMTSTSSSDLSVLLKEIIQVSVFDPSQIAASMQDALVQAGFSAASSPRNSVAMGCENFFERAVFEEPTAIVRSDEMCPLGADENRVAVSASFAHFVNELRTFKDSIVEVACKNAAGVLLSAFPTEWDKSFIAKGLVGMPDLSTLTSRFHVVNLVSFLHSIPSLELVAASPSKEDFVIRLRSPLNTSKSVVVLDDELFGADRSDSPVTVGFATEVSALKGIKQHVSPVLASQLLGQVERQVLELGTHLASKGRQSSASDLVLIRLQLQQLQSLKSSLQAVITPLPPPSSVVQPSVPGGEQPSAYASLLSQAAQFAMSAISASKKQHASSFSNVSTAVSSRKASPTIARELTKEDLASYIVRLVEKKSILGRDPGVIGMAVSSVKEEWACMFPALDPLDTYLTQHGFNEVKSLLLSCEKNLVVFYASLPLPQLRVAERKTFEASNQLHVTVVSRDGKFGTPLISPSSACSTERVEKFTPPAVELQRKLTELLLRNVRRLQIEAIRTRARAGDAAFAALAGVLDVVEKQKSAARLLESKRPPPIDTGSSSCLISSMVKQFVSVCSDILISKSAIVAVNVADIPSLWQKEFRTEFPTDQTQIESVPGVRVLGTKCTLTALANPGAIVASVFSLNDPAVWTSSNSNLVEAVKRVLKPPPTPETKTAVVTHAQLSELSSMLFKSIMAGGPKTAKDCAGALKLLASKDPKSIHEIVSSHITNLQQNASSEEAANSFVSNLMEKGKQLKKREKKEGGLEKLMAQLKQQVSGAAPPPGLKNQIQSENANAKSPFPESVSCAYSPEELVEIRSKMESLGQLEQAPEGIKNLRISTSANRRKQ